MNYTLAQITKKNKGFSLIELMVVISIIAILAVIGITIFSGAQKGARDAQRRSDVKNIIDALETKKGASKADYSGITLATTDFSSGALPADPVSTQLYCATPTGTGTAPATGLSSATTTVWTACPTGWTSVNGTAYATGTAAVTKVTVCAFLEQEQKGFCLSTAQ